MIHLVPDRPEKDDFAMADIWCPYQYPEELEELKRWGDGDLLVDKILKQVAGVHAHPCYSIPNHTIFAPRDLLYISVVARFSETDPGRFGYIVLSDNEASCLRIFTDQDELVFYNDPAEPADNRKPLAALLGDQLPLTTLVEISPRNNLAGVQLPAQFCIPMAP